MTTHAPWQPHAGLMVTPTIRLEHQLGQGGMGSVWRAHHVTLDTAVAVKFISPDVPPSLQPMLLERFGREARAAARIKSPHVVEVKDLGMMANGVPYLVMELLEGESLEAGIQRVGQAPLRDVVKVVTNVGVALTSSHALGIRHRDIKPANIFLARTHSGVVIKVLDFGIAKLADVRSTERALTATDAVLGTPDYMSPEQLLRPNAADHRVDLWSLAVVAFEMLTGKTPFEGKTIAALSIAICSGAVPKVTAHRPDLPQAMDVWFTKALHHDVEKRFQTAKELVSALTTAASSTIPQSSQSPSSGRIPKSVPRADPPEAPRSSTPRTYLTTAERKQASTESDGWYFCVPPAFQGTGPVKLSAIHRILMGSASPNEIWIRHTSWSDWLQGAALYALLSINAPKLAETIAQSPASLPESFGARSIGTVHSPGTAGTLEGSAKTVGSAPNLAGAAQQFKQFRGPEKGGVIIAALGAAAAALATVVVVLLVVRHRQPTESSSHTIQPALTSSSAPATPAKTAPQGMVAVQSSTFRIGCESSQPMCRPDEQPSRNLVMRAFGIMVREVLMEEYDECVAKRKCPSAGKATNCTWQRDGMEKRPINCVTWKAAQGYCSSYGWRLPSEEEWETAAGGPSAHEFPWGNDAPSAATNDDSKGLREALLNPRDKAWSGAFDLGGNLREWTTTDYSPYPRSQVVAGKHGKVIRGGSWHYPASNRVTTHTRWAELPNQSLDDVGFRCAVSI